MDYFIQKMYLSSVFASKKIFLDGNPYYLSKVCLEIEILNCLPSKLPIHYRIVLHKPWSSYFLCMLLRTT